jgi:hypothetical protein
VQRNDTLGTEHIREDLRCTPVVHGFLGLECCVGFVPAFFFFQGLLRATQYDPRSLVNCYADVDVSTTSSRNGHFSL